MAATAALVMCNMHIGFVTYACLAGVCVDHVQVWNLSLLKSVTLSLDNASVSCAQTPRDRLQMPLLKLRLSPTSTQARLENPPNKGVAVSHPSNRVGHWGC